MRSYSCRRLGGSIRVLRLSALGLSLVLSLPVSATRGVFQGRVVEGTKHEHGKYIYVAGPTGLMRRVNIQTCRVRFDASVPLRQRIHDASESLKDSAEVRVTADQRDDGEWVATEILILKLPMVDRVRLLIRMKRLRLTRLPVSQLWKGRGLASRRTLVGWRYSAPIKCLSTATCDSPDRLNKTGIGVSDRHA